MYDVNLLTLNGCLRVLLEVRA